MFRRRLRWHCSRDIAARSSPPPNIFRRSFPNGRRPRPIRRRGTPTIVVGVPIRTTQYPLLAEGFPSVARKDAAGGGAA